MSDAECAMIQSHVMQRIADTSAAGGALSPEQALSRLAEVINHLDMYSDTYDADLATLIGIGATLWEFGGRPEASLIERPPPK